MILYAHCPVLLKESIDLLNIKENGIYVDGTLGGGGHSREILNRLNGTGKLIAFDQDETAILNSKEQFGDLKNMILIHDNFSNLKLRLDDLKINEVDGIILDIGLSSMQIDDPKRGFSYMHDANLDMRMDLSSSFSGFNVVNEYSKEDLERIIFEYGEDRFAKNIAKNICEYRKSKQIETTFELVDIIKRSIPLKYHRFGHPAKRTFQSIRIEVNKELNALEKVIDDSIPLMSIGGRLSIITFHSLEDRVVKLKFKDLAKGCICPKDFPICVCNNKPKIKILTNKPIVPSDEEIKLNSRSASAKLRVCEKL